MDDGDSGFESLPDSNNHESEDIDTESSMSSHSDSSGSDDPYGSEESFDEHPYSNKIQEIIANFKNITRIKIKKHERYSGALFENEFGEEPDQENFLDQVHESTINPNV